MVWINKNHFEQIYIIIVLRELPLYDIVIDLDDPETTVSFNSLVANPAHEKSFETFSKKIAYQFNDEEQVITGVAISADTPIYRRDPQTGEEYYVNFSPASIRILFLIMQGERISIM